MANQILNPTPKKSSNNVAQMTPIDRQVLRDYAETLKRDGSRNAAKELERMNRMYAKYGMSFGKLPDA